MVREAMTREGAWAVVAGDIDPHLALQCVKMQFDNLMCGGKGAGLARPKGVRVPARLCRAWKAQPRRWPTPKPCPRASRAMEQVKQGSRAATRAQRRQAGLAHRISIAH